MNYRLFGAISRRARSLPKGSANTIAQTGELAFPPALSIPELRQLVAAMVD